MKLQVFPTDLSTTGLGMPIDVQKIIWNFIKQHNTAKIVKVAFAVIMGDNETHRHFGRTAYKTPHEMFRFTYFRQWDYRFCASWTARLVRRMKQKLHEEEQPVNNIRNPISLE